MFGTASRSSVRASGASSNACVRGSILAQRSDIVPGDLLVVRVGAGGSGRTCDRGCLERRESAGVRADVAHLEDSITAHLEQSQMFGIPELRRRSSVGASHVLNEYGV